MVQTIFRTKMSLEEITEVLSEGSKVLFSIHF